MGVDKVMRRQGFSSRQLQTIDAQGPLTGGHLDPFSGLKYRPCRLIRFACQGMDFPDAHPLLFEEGIGHRPVIEGPDLALDPDRAQGPGLQ